MSRFNHRHHLGRKEIAYRFILSALSITILVLFMPRQKLSTFKYRLGEPWGSHLLIAQDSFPVYKSEEALQRERDSLHRYYEPYFRANLQVEETQLKALTQDFNKLPKEAVPSYYLRHLQEKLHLVYSRGVMGSDDYDRLMTESTRSIWVYQSNTSSHRYVSQVLTPKAAYEFMMNDEDSIRYNHSRLQRCNLAQYLQPNLTYDVAKSLQQRQEVDNMLVPYMGQVMEGQKIVDHGQIVDEYTYNVLQSLERYQAERAQTTAEKAVQIGSQIAYATIMVMLLLFYFQQFRSDYLDSTRTVLLVLSLTLPFPIITYLMMSHHLMSVYMVPYCILPIFIRVFMDSRTAFITHMITILTCAVALQHPYEFILTQAVAGLTAIYSLRQLSQRSELFRAILAVIATTMLTYLCIDLLQGNLFSSVGLDRWTYIYLFIAGVLAMISYLLLIPIERIFGFTSTVTLVELSNINNKVLRRLSEEAPGTFQHSMQVSNLAAEVANRIGARSQLVRTAALYHDIGKLENPVFFTENQSGNNPHDELTLLQSAQIIINHVSHGLQLADKYKLPTVIKDFIATHHGQSMAKYFYITYKNRFPDTEVDPKLFTYPGPNPFTLEQAILMMADAVEAASRSLPEYTEDSVNALVDKIVDGQTQAGNFNHCPITFLDIEEAKEVFKQKLRTIYHTRIQYPELNEGQSTS